MDGTAIDGLELLRAKEARQSLLLELLRGQRETEDPETMMRAAAKAVGEYLQADRVGFFERHGEVLDFSAGWTAGRLPLLTGRVPAQIGSTRPLAKIRAGKTPGIEDATADPLTADAAFATIGTASLIGVPIIRNGKWHAGLYVNSAKVRAWSPEDIALANDAGEQTWDAVERARDRAALQKSQERLTLALEAAGGIGTWEWDIPGDTIYFDARFARLLSIDAARAASGISLQEYLEAVHPEDRAHVEEGLQSASPSISAYSNEYRVRDSADSIRWLSVRGRFYRDGAGRAIRFAGVAFDVTDSKLAQTQLQQQWQQFDSVLSHTPDFTYIFDLEGRFSYANIALLTLLGKTLDNVIGRNFHDLEYPPELAARLQRQIQCVIETGKSLRDETPFTGVSGVTGVYEYIFNPIVGKTGSVEAVAGSTRDITHRLYAERQIEADRQRWRDILLQVPASIAVFRGQPLRFEWVNGPYCRLVSRTEEALLGKTLLEAMPEVEGQVYDDLLNGVYRTGIPFIGHESKATLNLGKGTPEDVYLNFLYAAMRNSVGEIDGIFVHVIDVTDMVLARKRIEESEQRFRQLADSMPQMVWAARPDGVLDYCNERCFRFSGFEHSAAEQDWVSLLHPDDLPRNVSGWSNSLQTGEPLELEIRLWDRRKNDWRWFIARAVAIRDASGKIVRWFGTHTDIDEQKTAQQILLQTQKLESIGLLAGGIAHDFNNLLVGILGGASFAVDVIPAAHPAQPMLQTVIDSAERAAHLTRQMLAYSGNGRFLMKPVDLSAIVRRTSELVMASNPKSLEISLELADDLPCLDADPGQMEHVVMNLIVNAAEAVGNATGRVAVRTHCEQITADALRRGVDGTRTAAGAYVVLEVEDTGCGIEASVLPKIFDPFFTTKFTGRGLGLAAVSGVVRGHRGVIEVDTVAGKGSTFRVLLPSSSSGPRIGLTPATPLPSGKVATVLVIDDELMFLEFAKATLERAGFSTIVAESGREGLEYVATRTDISLVVLDMSMPGLHGRDVLEQLKAMRPALPVVVCSGYSEEETHRHFEGFEISAFLHKPFTSRRLERTLRSVLSPSDGQLASKS